MRENEKMKAGPSFKRNERDGRFDGFKTTKELAKPSRHHSARLPPIKPSPEQPVSNNQLLAGYLANEFLSKGTLFGQPWGPDRAVKLGRKSEPREEKDEPARKEKKVKEYERYMEVADLLKMDQVHLPRIVNPTQLSDVLFT